MPRLKKYENEWDKKRRRALRRVIYNKLDEIDPTDHQHLLTITPRHAADYKNFGEADVEFGAGRGMDCSGSCKWYLALKGKLGMDWGVCANPRSHRSGLLTFEHQGCSHFQPMSKVDKLYEKAVEFVERNKGVTATRLRRRFRIGYSRAVRLMEALNRAGVHYWESLEEKEK